MKRAHPPDEQLGLLDALDALPIPSNGVETSDEAARSITDDVTRLRRLVLNLVIKNGGHTCDEVEVLTGLTHQTASARFNDLQRLGRIVDSGERRLTRRKRRAIVWKVAPPGPAVVPRRRRRARDDFDDMIDWMQSRATDDAFATYLGTTPIGVERLIRTLLDKPWRSGAR